MCSIVHLQFCIRHVICAVCSSFVPLFSEALESLMSGNAFTQPLAQKIAPSFPKMNGASQGALWSLTRRRARS